MSYDSLSERAKLMCEAIELCRYYRVRMNRAKAIPGYPAATVNLLEGIRERTDQMTEDEIAALADFFGGKFGEKDGAPCWDRWLNQHLAKSPDDANMLFSIEIEHHGRECCAEKYSPYGMFARMDLCVLNAKKQARDGLAEINKRGTATPEEIEELMRKHAKSPDETA